MAGLTSGPETPSGCVAISLLVYERLIKFPTSGFKRTEVEGWVYQHTSGHKMARMSFLDNSLTSTTSQLRVLLAFITLAATYTFARIFFSWRLVDKDGNRIPNGPVGLPIVGAFILHFAL